MEEQRFNEAGIIIGQRGTGKTVYLLGSKISSNPNDKLINKRGLAEIYLEKGTKILAVDCMDHPSYQNFPLLNQRSFFKFNSGLGRVVLEPDNINRFVDVINQSPHMNNSVIVFEDAGKYTDSILSKPFKRLMIETKQRNIDIVFMYHSFIDTPSNIFTKIDFIQLFKTEDSPEIRKSRIRLYNKVWTAYEHVKNHPSRFYGKYIDTRTS